MTKKKRFPLLMEDEIEVKNLEELQDAFSLSKVKGYYEDGQLMEWLRGIYRDDMAVALEGLDKEDPHLVKNICSVLNVSYKKESATKEENEEREMRLEWLRKCGADAKYEDVIDNVAFSQEELYQRLDEDCTYIYLCGDIFSIPLGKTGVKYYGVNRPIVVINAPSSVDLDELDIELHQVKVREQLEKDSGRKLRARGKKCPPHLVGQLESIFEEMTGKIEKFFDENGDAIHYADLEADDVDEVDTDDYIVEDEVFDFASEARNHYKRTLQEACSDMEDYYREVRESFINKYGEFFDEFEEGMSEFIDGFTEDFDDTIDMYLDDDLQSYLTSVFLKRPVGTPLYKIINLCAGYNEEVSDEFPYDISLDASKYLKLCSFEYDEDGCVSDVEDAFDTLEKDVERYVKEGGEKLKRAAIVFFDDAMKRFRKELMNYLDRKLF